LATSLKSLYSLVLDPRNAIYAVKNVTSIPLTSEGAHQVLLTLATKNKTISRMSLLPTPLAEPQDAPDVTVQAPSPSTDAEPRVKFADDLQVKIMTPSAANDGFVIPERPELSRPRRSASPISSQSTISSGASTPTSETSSPTIALAKSLSDRLSFWNRTPARSASAALSPTEVLGDADSAVSPTVSDGELLDAVESDAAEKDELQDVLSSPTQAPLSEEDKHRQLEEKILRQTVKDYARGEMYFAYDFGKTSTGLVSDLY